MLRIDTGRLFRGDRIAHVIDTGLRQRPKIFGALETDTRNELFGVGAEPGQDKAGIAPRGTGGEPIGLEHYDRPAFARQLACGGQAGKTAADHADIDIEIRIQRRPPRGIH